LHTVLPAPAGQQGWPSFPQSHWPAWQVPKLLLPLAQASPSPMQRPARQQPPPPHFWPQQGCPAPPQTAQMPPLQTVPAPQGLAPGQQASPGPPQPTQVPIVPAVVTEQRVPGAAQETPQQL
jgi:hypothetical protein